MPVFGYRALTGAGRTRGGVIGAESARAAWQELRARGVYPTDIRERLTDEASGAGRLRAGELAAATRQLATLAEAGVPIAEALVAVAEHAEHPALVCALTVAHARLREGEPLADAFAASPGVFPPLFRDLMRAGEASGALAAVLARLADHAERAAAARARLAAALTYPAVMTVATVAVLAFLLVWVVPQLTELFAAAGASLPLATRVLLALTTAVTRVWWPALLAGAAALWAGRRWATTPTGRARLDALALGVPLLGPIVRKTAVARVARTLATLLAGGVPLDTALVIAEAGAGNRRIGEALGAARADVREGQALAPALRATGAFPSLLVRVVTIGERSGRLAPMLERIAAGYEGEAEAATAALTALVEPALVVVMGGVVLALVAAVLLPLFDLAGLVR